MEDAKRILHSLTADCLKLLSHIILSKGLPERFSNFSGGTPYMMNK